MNRSGTATDWEYAGIMSLNAGVFLGLGGWIFSFRSKSLDVWEDYILVAGAATTSIGASIEMSLPEITSEEISWSSIQCLTPFGAKDLNYSEASFSNSRAGALFVGYSRMYLSAWKLTSTGKRCWFTDQLNDGYSVGLEAKLSLGYGRATGGLNSIGTKVRDYIVPAINYTCSAIGYASGVVQAGNALLEGRGLACMYAFANGYARRLADITSEANWEISEGTFSELSNLKWDFVLSSKTRQYRNAGPKATPYLLEEIEKAGEAYVIQYANELFEQHGADGCAKLFKSQRELYGVDKNTRRKKYLDRLYRQANTKVRFGISIS